MLTENFTIILRLIFVQQHKKNVYQNIKSPFMKRRYQLLYVKWGGPYASPWGTFLKIIVN